MQAFLVDKRSKVGLHFLNMGMINNLERIKIMEKSKKNKIVTYVATFFVCNIIGFFGMSAIAEAQQYSINAQYHQHMNKMPQTSPQQPASLEQEAVEEAK